MRLTFEQNAWEELVEWSEQDKKIHKKILDLIKVVMRTPYEGAGRPEALKYDLSGYWSRRITSEHRIVYEVIENEDNEPIEIVIVALRYHYE
jgi:toxin YoeB